MLVGVHGVESLEPIRFGDRAKLRDVRRTVGLEFRPQSIRYSDANQCRAKQVRPLRDRSANQDSASAGAFTRKPLRRRVFVIDQILCASHKIFDCVRLGQFVAGAVPLFAIFAAAANMRDCNHASALQPRNPYRIEEWIIRNSISAIANQVCGMCAVQRSAFLANDR